MSSSRPWTAARLGSLTGLAAVVGLASPSAHAIIIRDDVPDADYVVDDAEYPALVTLFPPDDCAATLFDEQHLLTVAHCAVDLSAGESLDVDGTPYVIAEITMHPEWDDGDFYDIAVVRLEASVAGVTPIPIYRGANELDAEVTLLGRGTTATGLVGEEGGSSDGMLRRATNIVSQADELLLEVVFEAPGEVGITALEGVGASGDSGGPVLLVEDGTTFIAGLNAFGDAPGGIGIGQYGGLDYQTRVSAYADWIDGVVDAAGSSGTGTSDDGGSGPGTPSDSGSSGGGPGGLDDSGSSGPSSADGTGGSTNASPTDGSGGLTVGSDSDAEGCACSHRDATPTWSLLLVAWIVLRRRRYR